MNWSCSNVQYALLNEYAWEKKINWLRMFFIVLGQWWWLKQKKRTKKKKKRIWVLDILKRSNIGIRKLKIYITHLKYYQSGISKWPHMIKPGWCLVNKGLLHLSHIQLSVYSLWLLLHSRRVDDMTEHVSKKLNIYYLVLCRKV